MKAAIVGYHLDGHEGQWVAHLACGHNQHVRHDPPWQQREWVKTEEGRRSFLGHVLNCVRCDHQEPMTRDITQPPQTIAGVDAIKFLAGMQIPVPLPVMRQALIGMYGADAQYNTCCTEGLTAEGLLDMLIGKQKLLSSADGYQLNKAAIPFLAPPAQE